MPWPGRHDVSDLLICSGTTGCVASSIPGGGVIYGQCMGSISIHHLVEFE